MSHHSRCIFGRGQTITTFRTGRLRITERDSKTIVSTPGTDPALHNMAGGTPLRPATEHTGQVWCSVGMRLPSLTTAMGCGPVRSGCGFISTLAHPGGDRVAACADRPHRLPNRVADQLAAAHRWHFGQRCTRPDQGNLGAPRAGAARPSPALRCESATRSNVGQTGMFFTDLNESGHAGWSVAGTADPGEDRDLPFVVLFVQYVKAVDRFDD